jgi:hypothetical protein
LREIIEGIDQGNIVEQVPFDDLVTPHNRVHELALDHGIVSEHVLVQLLKIEALSVMSNKIGTVELGSFENLTKIINGTKDHGLRLVPISTLHLHVIHDLSIGILVGIEFPFEEGEGLVICCSSIQRVIEQYIVLKEQLSFGFSGLVMYTNDRSLEIKVGEVLTLMKPSAVRSEASSMRS